MSEPTPTFDRTAADRPSTSLSPAVRDIVTDALPRPDRSLAVGLCQVAREVGLRHGHGHGTRRSATGGDDHERGGGPGSEQTTGLASAVQYFEGYVRIRADLLPGERYDRPDARDTAVLASDYLHAAAYTQIGEVTDSSNQAASLYRVLTRGSTALATAFHVHSTDADDALSRSPTPDAVLAGTASEFGATTAGATEEVRDALERYGRSLLGAIAAHPSPSDAVSDVTAIVLSGSLENNFEERLEDPAGEPNPGPRSSGSRPGTDDRTPLVRRHVERARDAIATLEHSPGHGDGNGRSGSAPETTTRSPLRRLERATRIPFGDVVDDDG